MFCCHFIETIFLCCRGALDEERRAEKALILLKARDQRIAFLEKKISEWENRPGHDSLLMNLPESSTSTSSVDTLSRETTYLSLPPTEALESQRCGKKMIGETDDMLEPKEAKKILDPIPIPYLKLSTASVLNSERHALTLQNVNTELNDNSSLDSDDFCHDESSVDLVVTAALAFAKFNDDQWHGDTRANVTADSRELNDVGLGGKKLEVGRPRTNLNPAKMTSSLPWMKTRRRSSRGQKRGMERKLGKTKEKNVLSRKLEEVQAG